MAPAADGTDTAGADGNNDRLVDASTCLTYEYPRTWCMSCLAVLVMCRIRSAGYNWWDAEGSLVLWHAGGAGGAFWGNFDEASGAVPEPPPPQPSGPGSLLVGSCATRPGRRPGHPRPPGSQAASQAAASRQRCAHYVVIDAARSMHNASST